MTTEADQEKKPKEPDRRDLYARLEFRSGRTRWAIQAYKQGWQIERDDNPEAYCGRLVEAARCLADRVRRELPADLAACLKAQDAFVASLVRTTGAAVADADPDELPDAGADGDAVVEPTSRPRKDLREPKASAPSKPAVDVHALPGPDDVVFEYDRDGVQAECRLRDGKVIVLAQSTVSTREVRSLSTRACHDRSSLQASGALERIDGGQLLRVTRDLTFHTASAAIAVVSGVGLNGRTAWFVKGTDVTMREWEAVHMPGAQAASANG